MNVPCKSLKNRLQQKLNSSQLKTKAVESPSADRNCGISHSIPHQSCLFYQPLQQSSEYEQLHHPHSGGPSQGTRPWQPHCGVSLRLLRLGIQIFSIAPQNDYKKKRNAYNFFQSIDLSLTNIKILVFAVGLINPSPLIELFKLRVTLVFHSQNCIIISFIQKHIFPPQGTAPGYRYYWSCTNDPSLIIKRKVV